MTKILIADGSPDLSEFLEILLKRKGYEVEAVLFNDDLHEKVLSFAPDVILLDVQLHRENGRDICKQIKNNHLTKHIRIILISSNPLLLENYSACEADAVIEKPFNNSTVYETIERVLLKKSCTV
jgi:DNA-binding response OmpR family regulator